MDNNLTNMLLDSIESTVINTVERAGYNRTIQATIVKCVDSTIGQYQCKYQDSSFYAYSEDVETTYSDNTEVYILIQNNDFNADKRIIGSVKKLGINYIGEVEEENYYDIEGNSLIDSSSFDKTSIGLKSYQKQGNSIKLYDSTLGNNYLNIDKNMAKYVLQSSTSLMIDMNIQTKLDKEQQFRGNYGLRLLASFENESDGSTVIKEFLFDVDKFTGNPYKYINPTRQYVFFPINIGKFIEIKKIEIYCKDFPNSKTNPINDIFINNIKLFGANRMNDEELSGCSISLVIPQGSFFDETNSHIDKQVKAQVKLKGQVVNSNVQKIKYYWFREDLRVTLNSEYYNSIGGRGWKCLNNKNIIQADQTVVEWIPSDNQFTVAFADATAKENKFKCVIEYDNKTFSKEFVIKNMCKDNVFEVIVESDNGDTFYFDIGHLNLTCLSNYKNSNIKYSWAKEDINGYLEFLEETTELNEQVKEKENQLEEIYRKIEQGELLEASQASKIKKLTSEIDKLNLNQRVDGNKILNVDLSTIYELATFKCSCYTSSDLYIGTGSIMIKNKIDEIPRARVVIHNGDQVFKYNENGIAPTSESVENPISIPALSYTIYDENDNKIPDAIAEKCNPIWKVPNKRTLIKPVDIEKQPDSSIISVEEKEEYLYYKNNPLLTYDIESKYDFNKDLNNIELTVDYKGNKLRASTNLLFTKIGNPGTNGTDYVFRLRVNSKYEDAPKIAIATVNSSGYGSLNFTTATENSSSFNSSYKRTLFVAELWKNGVKVDDLDKSAMTWRMLTNKYSTTLSDESYYTIKDTSTGAVVSNPSKFSISYPANIIECRLKYDNIYFYATAPIITIIRSNSSYNVSLKENSGYQFVTYNSDGRNPTYNDFDPFEVIVKKTINGYEEDISNDTGANSITYTWSSGAQIYEKKSNDWSKKDVASLELSSTKSLGNVECKKNQKYAIPPIQYDGEALTHGIWVTCENICKIHIPVHLYLNRYGVSSINEWDGNSVQISDKGGYILSPQIGAGVKNESNAFTGVLMGKVKESNRSSYDIGILGYNSGDKTFFLNSEDGSLILGKANSGRIYMDPGQKEGLIYSDNFWTSTSYEENGKLKTGTSRTENGEGMLINLTKPEIVFGKTITYNNSTSRIFSVDKNGYLIANKGTLANFTFEIGNTQGLGSSSTDLYDKNETVTTGKFYTGNKSTISSRNDGFYIDSLGRMNIGNSVFSVKENGYMKAISGKIAAFNFNDKLFYSDGKWNGSTIADDRGGFYLDASISSNNKVIKLQLGANFKVTQDGTLTAKQGTLGSFTLTNEALYSKNNSNFDFVEDGIYIDAGGWLKVGKYFRVDSSGVSNAKKITLSEPSPTNPNKKIGFSIGPGGFYNLSLIPENTDEKSLDRLTNGIYFTVGGKARFGEHTELSNDGTLTAKKGEIAGLKFNTKGIYSDVSNIKEGFHLYATGQVNIGDYFSHADKSVSTIHRGQLSKWTLWNTMMQSATRKISDNTIEEDTLTLNGENGTILAASTNSGQIDYSTYWYLKKDGSTHFSKFSGSLKRKGTFTAGGSTFKYIVDGNKEIHETTLPIDFKIGARSWFQTIQNQTYDKFYIKNLTLSGDSSELGGNVYFTDRAYVANNAKLSLQAGSELYLSYSSSINCAGDYGLTGSYYNITGIKVEHGIVIGFYYN